MVSIRGSQSSCTTVCRRQQVVCSTRRRGSNAITTKRDRAGSYVIPAPRPAQARADSPIPKGAPPVYPSQPRHHKPNAPGFPPPNSLGPTFPAPYIHPATMIHQLSPIPITPTAPDLPDQDLLRDFAQSASQRAFTALVHHHVNFVYSCAVRQLRDKHLAEDVTQAVFLLLSRKAASLDPSTVLPGWLFRTTRYVALNARKSANRRRHHESIGAAMSQSAQIAADPTPDTTQPDWDAVSPHLDEALSHLRDTDRNAVLLRYFSNQSHRQVGDALGLSADAAKKRVDRALDKLRQYFTRKGVTVSAAALSTALATHGVQAAPAPLAAASGAVLTAAPAAGIVGLTHVAATGILVKAAAALITVAALTGGTVAVVNQRAKSQAQAPLKP